MNTSKPYSAACDRNKEHILNVLQKIIDKNTKHHLLEIGSGTGQHAAYIAKYFPNLTWHTSDILSNHEGIRARLEESNATNILPPISFEIGTDIFPKQDFDIVYTANSLHIMSWKHCKLLMSLCQQNLNTNALVIIYGPFNYNGKYTSDSNKEFDQWLSKQNHLSGIRDFEEIDKSMINNNFSLLKDIEMPANNRILVFKKN